MRKLIVQEFVTIDGFAAEQNGELDFMPKDSPQDGEHSVENYQWQFLDTLDTMVIGRNTYEMFVQYWPTATERIAPKLNAMNKVVCSTELDKAPWGNYEPATVISSNVKEEMEKLKQQQGKDVIIWGSIWLVQSLVSSSVIDEYQIVVCPSVIGSGKSLFC
ncbi:MAG: reductase [Sphingobacteriales bacterium]|nr:MAG: reductase [Sphingobacteriales bacterium]